MSDSGNTKPSPEPQSEHEGVVDRRTGLDRREVQGTSKDVDRRRGVGRRRTDFLRSAEEGEMSQEQFMFLMAINAFKKANKRTFPTWTDVLEVVRKLGYRKTNPSEIDLSKSCSDWTESSDASSRVD